MIGVHNDETEIEEFIKKNIVPSGECHNWLGKKSNAGHAIMHINGATFAVRRVLWMLHYDYLPQGRCMKDTCGNPWCCNLDHIIDSTPKWDQRKGLFRTKESGARNNPKVGKAELLAIHTALLCGDTTVEDEAKKAGVSAITLRTHLTRLDSGG